MQMLIHTLFYNFFFKKTSPPPADVTEALQLLPRQHFYLQISLTITTLSPISKKQSSSGGLRRQI